MIEESKRQDSIIIATGVQAYSYERAIDFYLYIEPDQQIIDAFHQLQNKNEVKVSYNNNGNDRTNSSAALSDEYNLAYNNHSGSKTKAQLFDAVSSCTSQSSRDQQNSFNF